MSQSREKCRMSDAGDMTYLQSSRRACAGHAWGRLHIAGSESCCFVRRLLYWRPASGSASPRPPDTHRRMNTHTHKERDVCHMHLRISFYLHNSCDSPGIHWHTGKCSTRTDWDQTLSGADRWIQNGQYVWYPGDGSKRQTSLRGLGYLWHFIAQHHNDDLIISYLITKQPTKGEKKCILTLLTKICH